ncbi:hypothetical protein P7C70_g5552, partial [Phenoliferia sp. Uapishka_3]
SNTSNTLAVAQAHGISADQFEEAKQQVMRFLRTDSTPLSPVTFEHPDKGKAKQTPVIPRSQSYPNFSAPNPQPQQHSHSLQPSVTMSTSSSIYRHASPSVAQNVSSGRSYSPAEPSPRPDSAPSSLKNASKVASDAYHESIQTLNAPRVQRGVRTRPSLEEIVERTGQRTRLDEDTRKEREVREWAEQSPDDSSSDEERGMALVNSLVSHPTPGQNRQRDFSAPHSATRATPFRNNAVSPSTLLPSPPFLDSAMFTSTTASPPILPQRGTLEHFMLVRPGIQEESDLEAEFENRKDLELNASRHAAHPASQPFISTGSPPRSSGFDPAAMMTSPAPSRGHPASVFDSPDISRLLTSELNQLNANSARLSARKSSPGIVSVTTSANRPSDTESTLQTISETLYSSPYPTRNVFDRDSPYSSGATKRTHDVFGSEELESSKRTRWSLSQQGDARAGSPTPSATSLSLRAPSFCDSSPAMSDRASTSGAPSRPAVSHSTAHPASAPDFAYHGLPSSSPASSQHSYSDPIPRQHHSSPGPTTSFAYARGAPTSNAAMEAVTGLSDSSMSRKRASLKRFDTSPALLGSVPGPDGSYSKPSWSYAALIGQAIFSTEDRKISLADIYSFIMSSYPYYRKEDSGWQNSIRHNLSLNECFIKTARTASNPGKGCLWAIAKGCEDQFADGGFTKKGSAGNGRKPKAGKLMAAPPTRFDPANLLRPTVGGHQRVKNDRISHEASPAPSSRGASPAPSNISHQSGYSSSRQEPMQFDQVPPARYQEASPTPPPGAPQHPGPPLRATSYDSRMSVAAPIPPTLTRNAASSSMLLEKRFQSVPAVERTFATTRRDSIVSMASVSSESSLEEPMCRSLRATKSLAAPYVHRPAPPPAPVAVVRPRREKGPPPPAASPPTSVYHRLAGPYQPISFTNSVMNHRALALLASPEATGIMPVHPDVYERALPPMQESPVRQHHAHFLPAPHIFPGSAGRRIRTRSEEKEDERPHSMFSPTAHVHTQSPVSSMRGERRAPMSPVQTTTDAFEPLTNKASTSTDPEKKRSNAVARSHLPSVAALADGSETFRTPPRLRSPSARLPSSALLQTTMVTPGGRVRPWGVPRDFDFSVTTPFSKRQDESSSREDWSPFGSRAQVAAEIEHFSMAGDSVRGSGLGPTTPRLSWDWQNPW